MWLEIPQVFNTKPFLNLGWAHSPFIHAYCSWRVIYVFLTKSVSWKWLVSTPELKFEFHFPHLIWPWFNTHAVDDRSVSWWITAERLQLKDSWPRRRKTTNEKSSKLVSFAALRTPILLRHFISFGYSLIDAPDCFSFIFHYALHP